MEGVESVLLLQSGGHAGDDCVKAREEYAGIEEYDVDFPVEDDLDYVESVRTTILAEPCSLISPKPALRCFLKYT